METPESITDKLSSVIGGREVRAAVFTTFNFEPEFFELDVIPVLLNQGIAYSADDRVKTFQVREALRESGLQIDVFYDKQIFMQRPEQSPQMEYLCHGVSRGNSCFHAKNIFLLVWDEELREESLLVAAGSNNITRAGWWRNIEVQHWEEVKHRYVSRGFRDWLRKDIAYLQSLEEVSGAEAIPKVREFLDTCTSSQGAEDVFYYAASDDRSLFHWLSSVKEKPLSQYENWNLEIISPYFCDDPEDMLHSRFDDLGVQNITMLLPVDDEQRALCQERYFNNIEGYDGIQWGQWKDRINETFSVDVFRRLHAKVYHFYNKRQAWIFVGSVNFSNKATGVITSDLSNVESGFFVRLPKIEPMLDPVADLMTVEEFYVDGGDDVEEEEGIGYSRFPAISIVYDWKSKKLTASTKKHRKHEIQIVGSDNQLLISPWAVEYTPGCYEYDTAELEREIRNSSFVTIKVKSLTKDETWPLHKVMIQQTGWTHKPIDLPSLTPEQILAIYAGMKPQQRQSTILNAMLQRLISLKVGGEITALESTATDVDFFCEYAEIFTSFRIFKVKLLKSSENDSAEVDYYLTGSGMDSLPTLLHHLNDRSLESFDAVNSYLILLSAKEVLNLDSFTHRPQIKEARYEVQKNIDDIKSYIVLNRKEAMTAEFFEWFERQFMVEYQVDKDYVGGVA